MKDLTMDEINNIKKIFNFYDSNRNDSNYTKKNNILDFDEFKKATRNLGLNIQERELRTYFEDNKDGIDIDTFINFIKIYDISEEKNKAEADAEENMNKILSSKTSRFQSNCHSFNPISTDNQMSYACNYKPNPIPRLENLYTNKEDNKIIPQQYNTYSNIKGGEITYYPTRRTVIDNFTAPNFQNKAYISATLYKDPMGTMKPEYKRTLVKNNVCNTLSYMKDTCEWREQLMATQMNKDNRTRYDNKWNIV